MLKTQNRIFDWLIILTILFTGAYLTVKASHENSWDGWGFGSAQTMLTIKHWVNDGWSTHYFLFVPAGYSKLTKYFSDSNLKHHAWGEITGSQGKKDIYYTHYPPGYLFPSAFLMELGFKNRFWFRFFQILISLTSLLLLYKFFNLISNKIVAFSATLFYMFSVPFLNFADSLANMPIDDFFRFLILALSVIALKNIGDAKKYNLHSFWIWLAYFILAISSYDSTFFIFIWLIGLDIIVVIARSETTKQSQGLLRSLRSLAMTNIKKWTFFASAPILAFILQMMQNSWYLGFSGMISDFLNAFNKIGLSSGSNLGFIQSHFLQGILYPITEAFALSFRTRYVFISVLIILTVLFILKKNKPLDFAQGKEIKDLIPSMFKYLFLFGVAGFAQSLTIIDNHPYKGRVLGVFAAFLIGAFVFLIVQFVKNKPIPRMFVFILFSITFFLSFLQIQRTFAYIRQWPNNIYDPKRIELAKELRNTIQPFHLQNIAIFSMFQPQSYRNGSLSAAEAIYYDMYYFDAPILYFNNISDLARDFTYLKQISKYPFSALMIMENKNQIADLVQILGDKTPVQSFSIQGKDILLIF